MKKKKRVSSSKSVTNSDRVLAGPDDLNVIPSSLSDFRILIFGPKAIGKTTMGSKFEGSIVGQLERGRKNLTIRQEPLRNWEDCLWFRNACIESDTVSTLVFDTLDVLYDYCLDYECNLRGIKHPGEMNDFGATWKIVRESFKDYFDPISEAGKGIICLSHEKKDTVSPRSGEPYDRLKPSCSGAAFALVEETFDFIFYYGKHGTSRSISVRPFEDANMEAECACGPEGVFLDPAGEPLSIFEIPNDPNLAYQTLENAFNNKVWDAIRGKPVETKRKLKGG